MSDDKALLRNGQDKSATLTILRGDARQSFTVPYESGMSVLDGLKYLSIGQADDLAFRWECGQSICGVCTMMINGQPALSCGVLMQPGGVYVCEPLVGFPVKKDLVVDLGPATDSMLAVQPYVLNGGRPIATQAEAEASKKLRMCVECWACVSICPVSAAGEAAHALSIVKLARLAQDPRDGSDRRATARLFGLQDYESTCSSCRRCADVCPKGIDVFLDAVQVLTG
jgi:succinate dehydrogenase/fumarate reductase iron-sulfur protein